MTKEKKAKLWTAGLVVSLLGMAASLIGLAVNDPEAAGAFLGAASKASKPRPYRKIRKEGIFGDTIITEYW